MKAFGMLTAAALLVSTAASAQAPMRIGVLDDMSGIYAESSGPGVVTAANMAVSDFGGKVLGRPIEIVTGDHQNKADVALGLAREWYDTKDVQAVFGLANSAVALAVQQLSREKKRIDVVSGAATTVLTGKQCSPYGFHWTYDTWATVFNQLETFNPAIQTTSIADWDVISAIAAAGSIPADTVVNIPQVPGDTDWLLTDDAVGDATELAIAVASPDVPNFVFSYFVGVDENGHMYGGDSPQYAAAINNVDRNLGEILQAVAAWEALTGEQWTILMTTDHGHQPQKGLGHGFQSPAETSTFVIAENPNLFAAGAINLQGQIVDVTPTVLTLFGATPAAGSEGVSLTDLGDANVFPVNDDEALRAGIEDVIDKYGYPDIGTQLALGLRTIFATVPYVVFGLTNDLTSALQAIADQDIFLISLLAKLAIVPVQFIGDITYVVTNTGAQIVARLTGVTGASIFPLWPPAPPSFPSTPEEATMLEALACGDAGGASAVLWCGEGSVAV